MIDHLAKHIHTPAMIADEVVAGAKSPGILTSLAIAIMSVPQTSFTICTTSVERK